MSEKRYPRAIMATACIPWTSDWKFDKALFCRELDVLRRNDIRSIYLYGTAGEGYAVSNIQYLDIVRTFRDHLSDWTDCRPMVGVISLSVDEMVHRIELAAEMGIRDFQISFPSWGELTDSEVLTFFHYICDRFPTLRFMHYNNAMRSRKKLGGAQYEQLAREIPNLVAVKHTAATSEEISDIMARNLPIQFFFLERAYGPASMLGEASLLISLCNINYSLAWDYFQAGIRQDRETIARMDDAFNRCADALALLPKGKMDGAYDKLFVRYSIPEFPISLYPPYEGMTEEQFALFDRALRSSLPQWF